MRLLIRPLMPRPKPTSRLYPESERWIFNALNVNDPPKKMTRTLKTTKRISLPRIFLLMHNQVGLNPFRHSPWKTRIAVLFEENPDDKAKARIFLSLISTPPPSGKTRTRIRIKKTYPILSATLISRKIIMPISVLRKSQKTRVSLDDVHVGDWG